MRRPSPFLLTMAAMASSGALFVWWVNSEDTRFLHEREKVWGTSIQVGDVVFQDLTCGVRCDLIRETTGSRYTHVGIVLDEAGKLVVWEAFHPVGPTPLAEWVARGKDRQVAIYRFAEAYPAQLPAIAGGVRALRGRPYDGDYQWDDERIYCSELIAKGFLQATGAALVQPHPSTPGAFGARAALIRQMSKGRLTEATPIVSPRDLTESPFLIRIIDELR